MPIASAAKSAVYTAAHLSRLYRAVAIGYRGCGVIFVLHSVVADEDLHADAGLRCPVGKLTWILRRLRRQGFDFVSMDEALRRLEAPQDRPFAAFTFDDGFADNLTRALPLMEAFAAPFTVYVTTAMVTREIDAWWFGLAALIRAREQITIAQIGDFSCDRPARKRRSFETIAAAIHRNPGLLPALHDTLRSAGVEIAALVDREALGEGQLQALARHPLVSIGAHTTTHMNLSRASEKAARADMAQNRAFLETLTERPVVHFAYPFGDPQACGEREAELAGAVGFRTGVTTRPGMLFAEHRHHLHALPRIGLGWCETAATLDCKLNGFTRAVNSRLGSPVARM